MYQGFLYIYIYTPKTNMESKNGGLEDEDDPFLFNGGSFFPTVDFQVPAVSFHG